jgi:hypothetical protein
MTLYADSDFYAICDLCDLVLLSMPSICTPNPFYLHSEQPFAPVPFSEYFPKFFDILRHYFAISSANLYVAAFATFAHSLEPFRQAFRSFSEHSSLFSSQTYFISSLHSPNFADHSPPPRTLSDPFFDVRMTEDSHN